MRTSRTLQRSIHHYSVVYEDRLTITSRLKSAHPGESPDSTLKQATTDPFHVLLHAVCYSVSKPLQVRR